MPEGHTIHRMARDHERWFRGQRVALSSPQGRFSEGAQTLNQAVFHSASAHGKHLFHRYTLRDDSAAFIHVHLGLYGKFRKRALEDEATVSPNCRLRIQGERHILDLSGPTCCEVLTAEGVEQKRAQLGPDPLREDGDVEQFIQRLSKRRIPIGAALLNQKIIAGIGNIYRAELLFKHRVNPLTPASEIQASTARELWSTAAWWLALGVKTNRIITTVEAPPQGVRAAKVPRGESLMVYGHAQCPECQAPVETREVGNRKLYACFKCQTGR
jgi:formamidopyrimidine-DNA glycosylase